MSEIRPDDWRLTGDGMMTDKQRRMLNAGEFRENLIYDPATGLFTWARDGRGQTKRKGAPAGSPHSNGYVRIKVDGVTYFAHRLAWILVHGSWPVAEIDHINGDRADNRISNLRVATLQENRWNTIGVPSRRKSSRFKGVSRENKSQKWIARIFQDGKTNKLGSFDTEDQASEAYQAAAAELRGEFAK